MELCKLRLGFLSCLQAPYCGLTWDSSGDLAQNLLADYKEDRRVWMVVMVHACHPYSSSWRQRAFCEFYAMLSLKTKQTKNAELVRWSADRRKCLLPSLMTCV